MTNKDLQARLAKLPDDAKVYQRGYVGTLSEGKIIDINSLEISEGDDIAHGDDLSSADFVSFHLYFGQSVKHILI